MWQGNISWWRHQIETFSALLAICVGNSPVPGGFPTQRPVTRSFDVFFDLRLDKRLSKQSWGWWFETLSRLLWRHRNVLSFTQYKTSRACITTYMQSKQWHFTWFQTYWLGHVGHIVIFKCTVELGISVDMTLILQQDSLVSATSNHIRTTSTLLYDYITLTWKLLPRNIGSHMSCHAWHDHLIQLVELKSRKFHSQLPATTHWQQMFLEFLYLK